MKKLILVAALALAGCMDAQSSERQMYGRYNGKPIIDLIPRWGEPESEVTKVQGTIYTFTNATEARGGPFCRINVYTNNQGRIQGLRHQGAAGACVDMYERAHQ